MIKNILFILLIFIAFISLCWWVLSAIDFIELLHLEQIEKKAEKHIAEITLAEIQTDDNENRDQYLTNAVEKLENQICRYNNIDTNKFKILIINQNIKNAFALPDNYIVLYTSIIYECKTANELAGILAHEIAHIEKKHFRKNILKQIMISVLLEILPIDFISEWVENFLKNLMFLSFGREREKEADRVAVYYLLRSNINPNDMATFFDRLAIEENKAVEFEWLSSHPDLKNRAKYIRQIVQQQNQYEKFKDIIATTEWQKIIKYPYP